MKGLYLKADWEPKKDYVLNDYERTTHKALCSDKVWKNPELRLIETEKPSIKPDEVLIQVKACGICGSDIHYVEQDSDGYIVYPGHTRLNIILGHELSGVITAVGSNVKGFKVGDAVCVEEMHWCGECIPCRNGFPNQCENLEEVGVTVNGGMAEYVAVHSKLCWNINEFKYLYGDSDKIYELGALIEPASVAYNAIFERGQGIRPGAFAVVFGAGPIGLLSTAHLKVAGAAKVIVFEIEKHRRELALKMGADFALNPMEIEGNKTVHEKILELTGGRGADIFIEAAGVPNVTYKEISKALAVNAKIVHTAMTTDSANINFVPYQTKAVQIFGTVGHSGNGTFENVIRLIASGRLKVEDLIEKRFPIEKGIEAFEAARSRKFCKVMIKF